MYFLLHLMIYLTMYSLYKSLYRNTYKDLLMVFLITKASFGFLRLINISTNVLCHQYQDNLFLKRKVKTNIVIVTIKMLQLVTFIIGTITFFVKPHNVLKKDDVLVFQFINTNE